MARAREFDEQKVLNAAGRLFWARGYEAVSTRDLSKQTGLTPSSMYAAFGDKRGLYMRSLDQYLERHQRRRIERLESSLAPKQAILAYVDEIVTSLLTDPEHRGCMMVNSALEVSSEDSVLQQVVSEETSMIEGFFRRCIVAGQHSGQIPGSVSADDWAKHLLSIILGMGVLVRVRPSDELLSAMVRPALAALGIDWSDAKRTTDYGRLAKERPQGSSRRR